MKPLAVLVSTFIILCSISFLLSNHINFSLCGRIAMALMLVFTGISHFIYTDGMELIIPDNFGEGFKRRIVLASGDLEFALAASLLLPDLARISGIIGMLYFFAIVPANIIACLKKVSIERGNYTGHGLAYLWFRIPLQIFFIVWIYYFSVYLN